MQPVHALVGVFTFQNEGFHTSQDNWETVDIGVFTSQNEDIHTWYAELFEHQ